MGNKKLDLDGVIETLLAVRHCRPGKVIQLPESDILSLCQKASSVFLKQSMLLKLKAPLKVCGDIHGQFCDLLRLFEEGGFPPESNYLFLGDYVDRGRQCVETISLLFAYQVKYPEKFHLLRGNHESAAMTSLYGFYEECKRRYSTKLWQAFINCFDCMPVAALIEANIFCCHGGLSPDLDDLEKINEISRPTDIADSGLLCDLLWSDPERYTTGYHPNDRGISYVFGPDVVLKFVRKHNLDLICRAHQVAEDGYEFFAERKLVTIFSAPNYCGEFCNAGAIMNVDDNLMCSFQLLMPSGDKKYCCNPGKRSFYAPKKFAAQTYLWM